MDTQIPFPEITQEKVGFVTNEEQPNQQGVLNILEVVPQEEQGIHTQHKIPSK